MDIFRTPGSTLLGNDKIQFDEVKEIVERGTCDKADWESNIACVDKINSLIGSNTLPEVVFLFRRRLGVREGRLVVLMLQLIESLVKNCGSRFHNAINEDKFMKEMANVTRRFAGKTTEGCRESSELALDLIQAWGEAFTPKQNQYPFIVRTYLELRKDGAHFKEQDPEKMLILTESIPRATPKHNAQADADAILAAKMQLELNTSAKSIPDSLASVSEDEFSASFFNSSVYQGHESGKMTSSSPPKRAVQKPPTRPQQHQQQQQHHHATHKKDLRKDSFDPSMYPDYDFGDSKPATPPQHQQQRPAPTSKQTSLSKRDSFDPSQYPDYDFSDVGHSAASSAAPKKKAAPVLNKRSSFDPSQYPDHNFNDDSHAAPEIPASMDRVDSVTADEVIQSFTFSLSILKDLILACTHERELRGNEVALEIVQQVAAMEGKMNDFIEHALIHETERVEQLFTLNEDAQTMLNVFNALVSGGMTLAIGKGKLNKINLTVKSVSHAPVAKKHDVAIDRAEHKAHHHYEEHKSNHPVPHQQYSQSAPNREHAMQVAHQQNSQRQQQQQAPPQQGGFVRPPMINTTSSSKPIKIKNDSIYGSDLKAASEDIIELDVNCMTSPQALDALFEDPAVLKARGTPIGIHISTEPAKFDPFSPDALDALFDKPVVKSTPRAVHATPRGAAATPRGSIASASPAGPKEFDPFSPDALDALFDTPPPAAPHVSSGQTPRHHAPPAVPGHHNYPQGAPQNGYPPHHAPSHQQHPPQHHQHPPTHPHHAPPSHGQYVDPYQQPQYRSAPQTPRNPSPSTVRPVATHGQPEHQPYGAQYQQSYAPQYHSAPQTPRNPSPGSARPSQTPRDSSPQDPHYTAHYQQYQSQQQSPQYPPHEYQDPHYAQQYQPPQDHRAAPRTPRGQTGQAAHSQQSEVHYGAPYQQQHAPPPQQYQDPHHAAPYQQHPPHYPPQQYGAPPPHSQYPHQGGAYEGYPPSTQQHQHQQTGYGGASPSVGNRQRLNSKSRDSDDQNAYYENN